ncbi:MAG: prephenate dehydrogenase/arogenate dehydrogenase family protein [Ilumatobacteraceae bacterium]
MASGLKSRGWTVHGSDLDPSVTREALQLGVISDDVIDGGATVTVVATPVSQVSARVHDMLSRVTGVVTDVGSVKSNVIEGIHDPRFIGGHPMAGSELSGLAGVDPDLFVGAAWVLTPHAATNDTTFETVASMARDLGSEIVVLDPQRHDEVVALVSHLPHLTAATLMGLAAKQSEEHVAILRLAAGGFRDMTRVASGGPSIWVDICRENKDAIVRALDSMIAGLSEMRAIVGEGESAALLERLQRARAARANLPARLRELGDVVEFRIPIPDRTGAAVEIFAIAAELGVNVANFEVAHSAEGNLGVLVLIVEQTSRELFRGGLIARGFKPVVQTFI